MYFIKLAEESAKPGATFAGSMGSAFTTPAAYLMEKEKQKQTADKARASLVAGLVPSLLKDTSKKPEFYTLSKNVQGLGVKGDVVPLTAKNFNNLDVNVQKLLRPYKEDTSLGTQKLYRNTSTETVTIGDTTLEPNETARFFNKDLKGVDSKVLGSLSEIEKPPKPNVFERLRDNIITDFKLFANTDADKIGMLDKSYMTKLLANITELKDSKLVPMPDPKNPEKTVMTLQTGVDMYKILDKTYGTDVVYRLRNYGKFDTTDQTKKTEQTKDPEKEYKEIDVGGTTFTILSSKDKSLSTTEATTFSNMETGLKDLKIAMDNMFPNGQYDRKLVAAMNLTPDWALSALDLVQPDGIASKARTTIQSMKRAIEIILRSRSGAAVPPAELENYLRLYLPNVKDNSAQAIPKIDALFKYFQGTLDGLNKGRSHTKEEDKTWAATKLPNKIDFKEITEGKKIMGRRVMIQNGVTYIETEKDSGNFQPLVTKKD